MGLARGQLSASHYFDITPSDTVDLTITTKGIAFVAAGDLHIIDGSNEEVTIPSGQLAAGMIHPMRVIRVFATGTTATGIGGYA